MNNCSFSGRLTRDPELKTFDSGKKVVKFCIAVDRRFQNKTTGEWESDPSFLDFEAWDKGAETIAARYKKGDFILVPDASVRTERWLDKNSGEKRQRLSFRCNHFELLPLLNSPNRDGEEATTEAAGKKRGRGKAAPAETAIDDDGGMPTAPVGEDEIPF